MRRALQRVIRALGSWRLAALLVVAWAALLVVWVIPFQFYGLPVMQMKAIVYRETFFQILYGALAVTTITCMGVRMGSIVRRVWRRPLPDAASPRLPDDATVISSSWESVPSVLRRAHFTRVVQGDGWTWGVRRSWSPFGTLLLHMAVLVLMLAGLVAVYGPPAFSGEAVVTPGEPFTGAPSEWASVQDPAVKPPVIKFTTGPVEASFYRDLLLFTRLEALVTENDGRPRRISLASPWMVSPDTLVAIKDFGYSVDVVASTDASVAPVRTYKLKVFPSEITDSFDVSVGAKTYRVYLKVFGDYVDEAGVPGNRSFNLVNPRMLVTVKEVLTSKAEVERVPETLVAPGDPILVPAGRVAITGVDRHAVLRVTVVPASPYIALALVMAVTGALMRLVWPRQEVTAVDASDGIRLLVIDDTYQRDRALEEAIRERAEAER